MCNWKEGLVSVITPMYNAQEYIGQTISSVQAQTYGQWEMVIVDDGSTDGSRDIVRKAMAQDARIRLIQQENGGVAAARNRGMREAEGQFLAFLDSDDLWKPEKLEYQLAFMREKQCVFSYAACDVIDENGDAVSKVRHVPEKITYNTLLKGNVIPCLTVVLDRNGVEEFSMPKMGHEDYAAWLNILKKIPVAYGTDRVLGSYRVNRKSVSANKLRTIGWTWRIYRENQKLSVFKSIRYLAGHLSQAVRKR